MPTARTSLLRRIVTSAVWTVVFVLAVHTWLVDWREVAGPSMAPALLGVHRSAVCRSCGHAFSLATDGTRAQAEGFDCVSCGAWNQGLPAAPDVAGDRVLVDRTAFFWRAPRRWEVVALEAPKFSTGPVVKRIVGLPGEKVQLVDGRVHINGSPADYPLARVHYDRPVGGWKYAGFDEPFLLGADEYFVLGDNGPLSIDSRYHDFGPAVHASQIRGKALMVHWPSRAWVWNGRVIQVPDISRIRYIR